MKCLSIIGLLICFACGAYAVGGDQPPPTTPVAKDSVTITGVDPADIPPPSGATEDKVRTVSREGTEYLERRSKSPPFGAEQFDLSGLRAGMAARQEPANKEVRLIRVAVGKIPCEWALAPGADPDLRLLYLHGGGWVSGSGGNYLPVAALISVAAKCAVLLPDYRLAPEHHFPAGLDDCVTAHDWMIANGPAGPAPASATVSAGDSAGGNLTLATLLALRDRKLRLPACGIPISAATDFTLASESLKTVYDPIISSKTMPEFRDRYLGMQDPKNPLASPVFGDYRGLPPLLIQVGEHEMLRDDSVRVAKKARADGISVKLEVWPGMVHVFQIRGLPESKESIEHMADFIRSSLPNARKPSSQAGAAPTLPTSPSAGQSMTATLPGGVALKLRYCPAGSFTMGSPNSETGRSNHEDEVQVRLSQGFWMAQNECTQAQWKAVMSSNPSHFKGDDLPVDLVTFVDVQRFIASLNKVTPAPTGYQWSLPTEAEWEYACRAAKTTVFGFGDTLSSTQANFNGNHPYGTATKGPFLNKPVAVGSYAANAWGIHDMHGNAWEWCLDSWDGTSKIPGGTNPIGKTGSYGVNRGGAWSSQGVLCRSAGRVKDLPGYTDSSLGFRLAAVPAGAR